MAREQTVVALSEPARRMISKRMAERGETGSTYFSNSSGGRSAGTASFVTPPDARTVTAGDAAGYVTTAPGISAVSPDSLTQYRQALVRIGLNQGMQDADLTMALYTSPEERRAARKAEVDKWEAEKKAVIGRLDSVVKGATESVGHMDGRPIADTAKWGRTIQKAKTELASIPDDAVDTPAIPSGGSLRSAPTGAKVEVRSLKNHAMNLWAELATARMTDTPAKREAGYDAWLRDTLYSNPIVPPNPLWQFGSENRFNVAAATAASHKRPRRK